MATAMSSSEEEVLPVILKRRWSPSATFVLVDAAEAHELAARLLQDALHGKVLGGGEQTVGELDGVVLHEACHGDNVGGGDGVGLADAGTLGILIEDVHVGPGAHHGLHVRPLEPQVVLDDEHRVHLRQEVDAAQSIVVSVQVLARRHLVGADLRVDAGQLEMVVLEVGTSRFVAERTICAAHAVAHSGRTDDMVLRLPKGEEQQEERMSRDELQARMHLLYPRAYEAIEHQRLLRRRDDVLHVLFHEPLDHERILLPLAYLCEALHAADVRRLSGEQAGGAAAVAQRGGTAAPAPRADAVHDAVLQRGDHLGEHRAASDPRAPPGVRRAGAVSLRAPLDPGAVPVQHQLLHGGDAGRRFPAVRRHCVCHRGHRHRARVHRAAGDHPHDKCHCYHHTATAAAGTKRKKQ
ncbi:hypothetical protein U1Q18_051584 [Sarracenia purpurea var. burkii]